MFSLRKIIQNIRTNFDKNYVELRPRYRNELLKTGYYDRKFWRIDFDVINSSKQFENSGGSKRCHPSGYENSSKRHRVNTTTDKTSTSSKVSPNSISTNNNNKNNDDEHVGQQYEMNMKIWKKFRMRKMKI